MKSSPFVEQHATVIRVKNLDAMNSWYSDVLGLTCVKSMPEINLSVYDLPGPSYLCLYVPPGGPVDYATEPHPKVLANWRTDDLEACRAELISKGVRCDDIMGGGGLRVFRFYDPEGTAHDCVEFDERWLPDKE